MKRADRKIMHVPLEVLWDEEGEFGERLRDLTDEEIRSILKDGPLRFIAADVGKQLSWISLNECFAFWKAIRGNISGSDEIGLGDFPGNYAYGASEWVGRRGEHLIVLEKFH